MRRYLTGDGRAMDDVAIERIRAYEADALAMHPNGYWLAHSGGKDSVVIHDLAKRAGVKHEAVHNLTTVDPPELVWFVRSLKDVRIDRPEMSMWQVIRENGMPPYRTMRYCCRTQKERGGTGRLVITGIRWAESGNRAKRQMVEACYRDKTRRLLHPIIDWPTAAVWEYIRERELAYCCLYDEGFSRVGCVLCPMNDYPEPHLLRWPKLCAGWERSVKGCWREGCGYPTPEALWLSWLDRRHRRDEHAAEPVLFEDNP